MGFYLTFLNSQIATHRGKVKTLRAGAFHSINKILSQGEKNTAAYLLHPSTQLISLSLKCLEINEPVWFQQSASNIKQSAAHS